MERGVVIGGLMVCGSFLLAALLNRSAMEEVPPPAPVVSPMSPPASDAELAPNSPDCVEKEASVGSHSSVAPAEPPASGRCDEPDPSIADGRGNAPFR